jgi:hypothetical protein
LLEFHHSDGALQVNDSSKIYFQEWCVVPPKASFIGGGIQSERSGQKYRLGLGSKNEGRLSESRKQKSVHWIDAKCGGAEGKQKAEMGKQKSAHWLGSKDEGRVENAECRIHKSQFRGPHSEN